MWWTFGFVLFSPRTIICPGTFLKQAHSFLQHLCELVNAIKKHIAICCNIFFQRTEKHHCAMWGLFFHACILRVLPTCCVVHFYFATNTPQNTCRSFFALADAQHFELSKKAINFNHQLTKNFFIVPIFIVFKSHAKCITRK